MAFDDTFNITWTQRIEKEEGKWLDFYDAQDAAGGQSFGGRRSTGPSTWPTGHSVPKKAAESGAGKHLKKIREKARREEAVLDAAASSSAAMDLSSASAALRRRAKQNAGASGRSSSSRASGKSRGVNEGARVAASASAGSSASLGSRSTSMPALPHQYRALASCPVAERDLITIRHQGKPTDSRPAPQLQFRPETIKAMWWPGRGTYTKFHPVFTFEEAPAMDVEANLIALRPSCWSTHR